MLTITFDVLDADPPHRLSVCGRDAWALSELLRQGERGCTPIDNPAPRWSGYVHNLRKMGVNIETVTEKHGGPFAGHHARYVLRSRIVIVAQIDESEAA